MEQELVWKMVQGQIGYEFKNLDLLKQAFTRRSYSEENGGENNEVLEFIGDKVLDFVAVRILIQNYGHLANGDPVDGTKLSVWEQEFKRNQPGYKDPDINSFSCDCNENDLTKIKSRMVSKKALAGRMDELGFSEYLIMGKGDIKNNVQDEEHVKEDLFGAAFLVFRLERPFGGGVEYFIVSDMQIGGIKYVDNLFQHAVHQGINVRMIGIVGEEMVGIFRKFNILSVGEEPFAVSQSLEQRSELHKVVFGDFAQFGHLFFVHGPLLVEWFGCVPFHILALYHQVVDL